jgi:serine/threonine-protein kinase RsbW
LRTPATATLSRLSADAKKHGIGMDTSRERLFERNLSALDSVFEFVSNYLAEFNIAQTTGYALQFAVEEVFTNLVKYDPGADPVIPIRMIKCDDRIIVEIVNVHGRNFDMTSAPEPDTPHFERGPGGLGLYLVRRMVDEFRYKFADGKGTVTIIVSLEE